MHFYGFFYFSHQLPDYLILLLVFLSNTMLIYDNWKKEMNESNISTRYKNDILKFLKSVLNFAMTWYDFNLNKVYSKMTKFSNSSNIPKEMMYFTYDQWKQFISVETELQKKLCLRYYITVV